MYCSQIRLNEITADKVKYIAKKNKRSMNNMMEFIIERYIDDYERINDKIILNENDME